jgi:hypothetical protein
LVKTVPVRIEAEIFIMKMRGFLWKADEFQTNSCLGKVRIFLREEDELCKQRVLVAIDEMDLLQGRQIKTLGEKRRRIHSYGTDCGRRRRRECCVVAHTDLGLGNSEGEG